ncbi:hypothetical protein Scep_004296 [Stephania cephalantha]|uniref:Uncharacterized protein n=1 Tax=Stephania cephalantha TaxID=152367 RepID=A0AAP0KS73_9MAGN
MNACGTDMLRMNIYNGTSNWKVDDCRLSPFAMLEHQSVEAGSYWILLKLVGCLDTNLLKLGHL